MRLSQLLIATLREDPADAEIPSHRLLARGGFIVKIAAGVYTYSPLMWRVIRKFSQIVREELDRAGAQEVMLPIVQPKELWVSSGRWDRYVRDVLRCAGARNVCDALEGRYPEVSVEWLRSQQVDVVVLPDEPWEFTPADRDALAAGGEFPAGARVLCASGKDFCWHGVRTAPGLGAVRSLLRPLRRRRTAH